MSEKRALYQIVTDKGLVFKRTCTEGAALEELYRLIDLRTYKWLELRKGSNPETDVVVDSAWSAGKIRDGRHIYQHEDIRDLVQKL